MFSTDDTIVAIATPPGRAGLGVIRISGPDAQPIASHLLTRRPPLHPREATLSHVRDLTGDGATAEARTGAGDDAGALTVAAPDSPRDEDEVTDVAPTGLAGSGSDDERSEPAQSDRADGAGRGLRAPEATAVTAGSASLVGREAPPLGEPSIEGGGERSENAQSIQAIDQVVATFFPRPHSYTGEDVVELAAHGSPILLQRIVASALRAGARLAAPGEFTLRAFLHGRVDLVQAEAVADLIDAVTPAQARQAFDQLEGTLTRAMKEIGESLFDLVVKLEASLDFPDEGYHFIVPDEVSAALAGVQAQVAALLASARQGRVIREGRQVAIVGGTNVGKSSLFNAFVGADRAIVTEIAGTTRDLLTERCDVGGIPITLVDTAGIRETEEIVEREGVQRARAAAQTADLVLVVLDRSRPLREQDRTYIDAAGARRLVVINKVDLPAAWSIDDLTSIDDARVARSTDAANATTAANTRNVANAANVEKTANAAGTSALGPSIDVSVRTGAGMQALRDLIAATLVGDERLRDTAGVSNVRHIGLLEHVAEALDRARAGAAAGAPEEFVLADIREAIEALEEITGKRSSDDVLQAIFSRFCIGK
jgi:tRNA modification GTPase